MAAIPLGGGEKRLGVTRVSSVGAQIRLSLEAGGMGGVESLAVGYRSSA